MRFMQKVIISNKIIGNLSFFINHIEKSDD
jgi:hypothetical protein